MNKLFLCGTQYHVLEAVAACLKESCRAEIGLSDSIPGRLALADRLRASGLFERVYCPADSAWPAPANDGAVLYRLRQRLGVRRTGWKVNPARYDEIVVYNDWTPFGRWLQDCKACYVLGEDTRNHLDHPNQYIDGQAAAPDFARRQREGKGYLYWGAYRGVQAVEMTDPARVAYYPEKARTFDLFAILGGLSSKKKAVLRRVFVRQELPKTDKPACLLLPRSFYVDHDLPSQDAQNRLVTDTVERYCKGYQLYVKTHPRDTTDYEQLLPDAVVLDRFMPSELLDYCFEVRFARAVGLCTASVRNLQCADEKISLDYDYIAPYQKG